MRTLTIGTRGSALALAQTNWVRSKITAAPEAPEVEIRIIKTRGDRIVDRPLARVGGKGLFVKELEEALLREEVDLAVHSLKDLPAEQPEGLVIAATPPREDPRDTLVLRRGSSLRDLPARPHIGTSSLRRGAQLMALLPGARISPLRGNVGTRLRRLEEDGDDPLDAIVLAMAGLRRLDLASGLKLAPLDPSEVLPAVGQGSLAIECRENDAELRALLCILDDEETAGRVAAERAFLEEIEGSCQVPVGAYAEVVDGGIHIRGLVASLDGKTVVRSEARGAAADAADMGRRVAAEVLAGGGREILDACLEIFEAESAGQP